MDTSSFLIMYSVALTSLLAIVFSFIVLSKKSHRHIMFMFVLNISSVYLLFVPLYSFFATYFNPYSSKSSLSSGYLANMLYSLLLFIIPMIFIYILAVGYTGSYDSIRPKMLSPKVSLYRSAVFAFTAIYLIVTLKNDLIFSRIGAEALLIKYEQMPSIEFFAYRSFQELFSPILISGIYFLYKTREKGMVFPLVSISAVYFLTNILNSRIAVINLFLVGAIFVIMSAKIKISRYVSLLIPAIALGAISANFVVLARQNTSQNGVNISQALGQFGSSGLFSDSQGLDRINCTNTNAMLYSAISQMGAMQGAAWNNYYWIIIGRYTDPEGFQSFKLSLKTASKTIILQHFLSMNVSDYVTCSVTDLYANFGPVGYLILSLFYSLILILAYIVFRSDWPTLWIIPLSIILSRIVSFDREGGDQILGWAQFIPLYILFCLGMMFVFARNVKNTSHDRNQGIGVA